MKGEHTKSCDTPSKWFRRLGSVWACPECRQLWVLATIYGYGGPWREWIQVDA